MFARWISEIMRARAFKFGGDASNYCALIIVVQEISYTLLRFFFFGVYIYYYYLSDFQEFR